MKWRKKLETSIEKKNMAKSGENIKPVESGVMANENIQLNNIGGANA
jgi:hypothetical protein